MDRAKLAKSNLKKSVIFGGSIGLVTLGGGLAVAIPTYYKIKKSLEQALSKTANLSSYMSQLVNKLGVSPDEDFVSELEGGYELVYQNGETKIFRRDGDSKTLVMNMNADGTVGSAATMTGPAALGMIQIVQSAASTLSENAEAMEAVLGPFAEATEKTSVQIESAVTGTSPAQILARNALANPDAEAAQKALDALKADTAKLSSLGVDAKAVDAAKVAAQADVDKQRADAAAEAALSAQELAAQRERQRQEALARIAAAETALKATYKSGLVAFHNGYKVPFDNENGIIEALDITETEKEMLMKILKMSTVTDIDVWIAKPEVKVEEVRANFNAAKNASVVIEAMAAARAQQAKNEALAAERNDNLLVRIASNLDSFLNAYARTYGYDNQSDPNEKHVPVADSLRAKLGDKVVALGMNRGTLNNLDAEIKRLLGTQKDVKLTFSVEVNTFSEANPEYSKLVVLKANTTKYTGANQFTNSSEYVLATSGVGTYIDLNKIKIINKSIFPDETQLKQIQTTIGFVVQLIKSNILVELKNAGISILKQEVRENTIQGVKDPKYFDQLSVIAREVANLERETQGQITDQAVAIKALKKQYLVEWLLKLTREYLFGGQNIQFNGAEMIALTNKIIALDKPVIPQNPQNIYNVDGLASSYGEFMRRLKSIFDSSGDKQIPNRQALYSIFGKGIDVLGKYDATKIADMKRTQAALYDEIQEGLAKGVFGSTTKLQDLMNLDSFKNLFTSANFINYNWTKLQDLRNYSDVTVMTTRLNALNTFAQTHANLIAKVINSQNWNIVKDALIGSDAVFTQFMKSLETLSSYDETKILALQTSDNALFAKLLSASDDAHAIDVMGLDSFKTLFTDVAFANYSWAKLTDLSSYKDLTLVDNHIKQILAIANTDDATKAKVANLITSNNWVAVKGAILNDQADITFTIKDMLKYAESKDFDMTSPVNQEKIQAASGVSQALSGQKGIDAQDIAEISSKMTGVMTAPDLQALTPDQFKAIVEYTNTVFDVITSPAQAATKLKEVLDSQKLISGSKTPAENLQDNIQKIITFNEWVKALKAAGNAHPTTDDISDYVWHQAGAVHGEMKSRIIDPAFAADLTSGPYKTPKFLVTGAITDKNFNIYSVAHTQQGLRAIKLSTDGRVSMLGQSNPASDWGSNPVYLGGSIDALFGKIITEDKIYQFPLDGSAAISIPITNHVGGIRIFRIANYDEATRTATMFGVIDNDINKLYSGTITFDANGKITGTVTLTLVPQFAPVAANVDGQAYAFETYKTQEGHTLLVWGYLNVPKIMVWDMTANTYRYITVPNMTRGFGGVTIDSRGNAYFVDWQKGNVYILNLENPTGQPRLLVDVHAISGLSAGQWYRGIYFNPLTYQLTVFSQAATNPSGFDAESGANPKPPVQDIYLSGPTDTLNNIFKFLIEITPTTSTP